MTTLTKFLEQLKNAANEYLNSGLTYAQYKISFNPSVCRELALTLSKINTNDPEALIAALKSITDYIESLQFSENTTRFLRDFLKPIFQSLKADPIKDLPKDLHIQLQQIEFPRINTNNTYFSEMYRELIFDGMGYGNNPIDRHPHFLTLLQTEQGCKKIAVELGLSHRLRFYGPLLLSYFFLQPNAPTLTLNHFCRHFSDAQHEFIRTCLLFVDPRTILSLLQALKPDTKQLQDLLPSFVFGLAHSKIDRYFNFSGIIIQETKKACEQATIDSLAELKRLGLVSLSRNQLLALITEENKDFYRVPLDKNENRAVNEKIAKAILLNPQWQLALLLDINSPIHLSKVLSSEMYAAINNEIIVSQNPFLLQERQKRRDAEQRDEEGGSWLVLFSEILAVEQSQRNYWKKYDEERNAAGVTQHSGDRGPSFN